MTITTIEYDLQDNFIVNWLTAGPQTILVPDFEKFAGDGFRSKIRAFYAVKKSGIRTAPVERGPLSEGLFKFGEFEGSWSYTRCPEDHFIDHSKTFPACHFMRSWAYTQIASPADCAAKFTLTTCGAAEVWINNHKLFQDEDFTGELVEFSFEAVLSQGVNEVLVRFETVAAPVGILVCALRVADCTAMKVRIPTLIPSLDRRKELEEIYERIYLDRDVYAADDQVYLQWPEEMEKPTYNDVHFKEASGLIQGTAEDAGKPGDSLFLGSSLSLKEGNFTAFVMPRAWEYYESQIRITKELNTVVMGRYRFSDGPYGTLDERRGEALTNAARRQEDLFAEIAKMGLGQWQNVETKILLNAVDEVTQRQAGSELTLLALLGMVARYAGTAEFPQWIKDPIKEAVKNFRFWLDEPGCDLLDYNAEGSQIVFHAAELLAGQLYPNQVFTHSGLTGFKQRKAGEQRALAWMQAHGRQGFANWDSDVIFAQSLIALSHLVDLAKEEAVWDLASVLMDKMFFALALNSYKGVFGSTKGIARSREIKSGLLDATSGIARLMWGMGVFNDQISGAVSLAQMEKYSLPPIIADIAAGLPAEMWNREQAAMGGQVVNKATYRTPNGMLSSAQDYHPGQSGGREHIWQATLGPNSIVFANHPGASSEKDERVPNFWRGNGTLPRVAQYKDVLIALYKLPEQSRLRFTHAYFPMRDFDEAVLREGWAFARKGDGYIALTASPMLDEIQEGKMAHRELRVYGDEMAWICQMGRAALDEDFASFQEKILGLKIDFSGLQVDAQTLRGNRLSFGWEDPFLCDGEALPLSGYKHFDNPYTQVDLPCTQMEIKTEDYLLRLDFGDL